MTLLRFMQYLLLGAVALFLLLFLVGPVYTVVEVGLDWQLLREVFSSYIYVEGLWNSFLIALVTTSMVFVISLPLALLYDRYEFPLKNWCSLLMMLPMMAPSSRLTAMPGMAAIHMLASGVSAALSPPGRSTIMATMDSMAATASPTAMPISPTVTMTRYRAATMSRRERGMVSRRRAQLLDSSYAAVLMGVRTRNMQVISAGAMMRLRVPMLTSAATSMPSRMSCLP